MNAVEQMMQSFSISSQPQLTALLSPAAQQVGGAGDIASQFAALLQNSSAALTTDNSDFQIIEPTQASAYIIEGVTETTELPDFLTGLNPADITFNTAKTAELPSGIPGLQLVQLTGLELNNLVESGQIQQLPAAAADTAAQQTLAPADTDLFLFAAGTNGSNDIHLLPLAQLEAITSPLAKSAQNNTAVVAAPPASGIAAAASALTTDVTTPTPTITPAVPTEAANKTSELAVAAATAEQVAVKNSAPTLAACLEAVAKQPQQPTQPTTQNPDDAADAEGHAVAANAANKKVVNPVTQASASQQSQAPASQQAAAVAAHIAQPQAGKTPASDKLLSKEDTKASSPQAATQAAQMAPARAAAQMAQQPMVTWTPEQVAGSDGAASEIIASGLGGLKGENSFMGSMGLIGGKASPALGAHVAKQLNLNMSRALKNGDSEFNMRMDPAELGRVKVKLTFGSDGLVTAKVMAERPETLEMLQRETRSLERAMETGGHKSADGGIQFSLDTGDGESAGKAFAEAVQQDNAQNRKSVGGHMIEDELLDNFEEMDEATLNEILANVTPETGLDVRV